MLIDDSLSREIRFAALHPACSQCVECVECFLPPLLMLLPPLPRFLMLPLPVPAAPSCPWSRSLRWFPCCELALHACPWRDASAVCAARVMCSCHPQLSVPDDRCLRYTLGGPTDEERGQTREDSAMTAVAAHRLRRRDCAASVQHTLEHS